jgi:hypothetical protein
VSVGRQARFSALVAVSIDRASHHARTIRATAAEKRDRRGAFRSASTEW